MHNPQKLHRISGSVLLAILVFSIALVPGASAAGPSSFARTVAVDGFTVSYPDGWSAFQSSNVTILIKVKANLMRALDPETLLCTPQIRVTIEQRIDQNDAVRRLADFEGRAGNEVTSLTVAGWPAIQRRRVMPWPQPGESSVPSDGSMALTITTAIAADMRLIRLDGSLPADAPPAQIEELAAIEASLEFPSGGVPAGTARAVAMPKADSSLERSNPAAARERELAPESSHEGVETVARPSPGLPSGAIQRIFFGGIQGVRSEPEVAVSSDGRNIVVAQQVSFVASNDGGKTFPYSGGFPVSTGGDSSLAFGISGNFYEATISGSSTAINVSTDNGQTFSFRANAFTCGMGQCGFGILIPDQEHIGADQYNATVSGDQVYSAFRNGFVPPSWGLVCSTDSGTNWGGGNVGIPGDFPRVTVGRDGFAYVAYVEPVTTTTENIMLNKFAPCSGNANMTPVAGFPKTVAAGVSFVPCPVPGLNRCNSGNDLTSVTAAVDDTNASHVYVSYAVSTGAGNENIVTQDSTDGGATWSSSPSRKVTINTGGTARRYMPWMCTTNGTAFVSWYDRRSATAADNDLTDYFGATAALDGGGNLAAGSEFQINASGTADAECEAGQPVGSPIGWVFGPRAMQDSESCSRQPQLAGVCRHNPAQVGDSNQPCDFNQTACPPNTGESCQPGDRGGVRWGDYNGNACVKGHFLMVWASATPPAGIAASGGIDLFFGIRDTVQPIAKCKDRTVPTDPDLCSAANVSIDDGSTDPDGDTFTLSQSPPGPYNKGTTPVTLTITDQNGQTNSCMANITVVDNEPPKITCPPDEKFILPASPSGAIINYTGATATDNCDPSPVVICTPASGSLFPLGDTMVHCTATDASGNHSSCDFKITLVGCPICDGTTVVVNQNVTVDFNPAVPTCSGDPDLCALFSFDNSGPTPDTWKAIFDLGAKKLLVQNGATITTVAVPAVGNNRAAPGIEFLSTCSAEIQPGGSIVVTSVNMPAGAIVIQMNGDVVVNGTILNQVTGTNGTPGAIDIETLCGNVNTGPVSLIQTIGQDHGGSNITLRACEQGQTPSGPAPVGGNILITGLVDASYKAAPASTIDINAPSVIPPSGKVTIDGNNLLGIEAGTGRRITSGVTVRSRRDPVAGFINIQSGNDLTVLGNRILTTNPAQQNFGAVAIKPGGTNGTSGDGALVGVSLAGRIVASDRAFDFANRFNTLNDITLFSKGNIELSVTGSVNAGAADNTKAVVSTQGGNAGQGGTNTLRSFSGAINIGTKARVLADFAGTPGVNGTNLLTACIAVNNSGTVSPADLNPGDDSGVCAPPAPSTILPICPVLDP